jgi:hypothetical protein
MNNMPLDERWMIRNVWVGFTAHYYAHGNWQDLPYVYETEEEAAQEAKAAAIRWMR